MADRTIELYLKDLGTFLLEKAKEAKERRDAETDPAKDSFHFELGRLVAYQDVVSLMQSQANLFEIPLESLGLQDFDPEKELM